MGDMFAEDMNFTAVGVFDEGDDLPREGCPSVYHSEQDTADGKAWIDLTPYLCYTP